MTTYKRPLAWWRGAGAKPVMQAADLAAALIRIKHPLYLLEQNSGYAIAEAAEFTEKATLGNDVADGALPLRAYIPACRLEDLGDAGFRRDHGLRYPYIAGAMANGISSVEIVEAMGRAGMLGVFGAAGLMPEVVEDAIDRISARLGTRPWGVNLIHSPYEPALETALADLYLRRGVHLVSASAYLNLTLDVVRYRVHGIYSDAAGRIITPNRVIAKISRVEVAEKFLAPPPAAMLAELVRTGHIDEAQARMAATIPVAQDLTVEADSGGHTDNRPALALLPTLLALRDRMQANCKLPLHIGAAGGIATPHSAAAAFAMGADFILTGSVNQACREANTSDAVRQMLAEAKQADVIMAPAADMFEMGVKLQVLKRGTMFAMRAQKLYDLYRACNSLEEIPKAERATIEKSIFRAPLEQVWEDTRAFWSSRDSRQTDRAARDPKHRMALVFRWYLGQSSRWAIEGEPGRKPDYQIWSGPAIGAFNEWVRGSFLESWQNRRVVPVALNILHGAAVLTRANNLRTQGIASWREGLDMKPRELFELEEYL